MRIKTVQVDFKLKANPLNKCPHSRSILWFIFVDIEKLDLDL